MVGDDGGRHVPPCHGSKSAADSSAIDQSISLCTSSRPADFSRRAIQTSRVAVDADGAVPFGRRRLDRAALCQTQVHTEGHVYICFKTSVLDKDIYAKCHVSKRLTQKPRVIRYLHT